MSNTLHCSGLHPAAFDEFGNFGDGAFGLLDELQYPSDKALRGRDLSVGGSGIGIGHCFRERMTQSTHTSHLTPVHSALSTTPSP